MSDITLVYYSACRIPERFAYQIRARLRMLAFYSQSPIVSVTLLPVNLGHNICIGVQEPSAYHVYQQILIGAMVAKTPFIACCEDDSLYHEEHLSYRPAHDTIAYNVNRLQANQYDYYYRQRAGMCMCIAPRALLIQALCRRFEKYPHVLPRFRLVGFGEPGRKDNVIGLANTKMEIFRTKNTTITFNHRESLGGVRRRLPSDEVRYSDPYWGRADSLWQRMHT
jgi:hypothetical protein